VFSTTRLFPCQNEDVTLTQDEDVVSSPTATMMEADMFCSNQQEGSDDSNADKEPVRKPGIKRISMKSKHYALLDKRRGTTRRRPVRRRRG